MAVKSEETYEWEFKARFRRNAFGWRSQPAISRIKEAVKEIRTVSRAEPALAAEGAVVLLERLSPALTNIDSSSGAIGTAVNNAIEKLVPIIADAPVDGRTRDKWLDRLWQAHADDEIPYIESLADHWGQLCASKEKASAWADKWIDTVRMVCGEGEFAGGYYDGASACLSALLKAERYDELSELLDLKRMNISFYQDYRVKMAIAKEMGIAAIEVSNKRAAGKSSSQAAQPATAADYNEFLSRTEISGSYLNIYKSAVKKFPDVAPDKILGDLIATTPGAESKWFAAAKELKDFELAMRLAYRSPCDPRTLTRAARDHKLTNPVFAAEAGLAAIHWLIKGHGLDITPSDIRIAFYETMEAAKLVGQEDQALRIINEELEKKNKSSNVCQVLMQTLQMKSR
jgi:hypothetical protein